MEWMPTIARVAGFGTRRCRVPARLEDVTTRGEEDVPSDVGVSRDEVEKLWKKAEALYLSGAHPAIQLCVRREGAVVLNRAIGHASGNGPGDPPDAPKRLVGLDTPINLFSASKAITAMLIHWLDERGMLRLDDWVCEYIPEFARFGKHRITIRHVLAHRSGVPNLPPEALDLDLLGQPERVLELLCDARLQSRPGRLLAYHAVTGGFILAEVAARASGRSLRELLREEVAVPLGLRWMNYGVTPPDDPSEVALNAFTGPPVPPPLSIILKRALGTSMDEVVDLSNDPRFIRGVIPSANVMTTADETSRFYECLLNGGQYGGNRIFAPRTVRHATAEQSWWEIDFTLLAPIRYGLGFMLGNPRFGPFGVDNPHAFGHIGFSNVFTWADPERALSVALLTTGKPVVSLHVIPLFDLLAGIGNAFPRIHRVDASATTHWTGEHQATGTRASG